MEHVWVLKNLHTVSSWHSIYLSLTLCRKNVVWESLEPSPTREISWEFNVSFSWTCKGWNNRQIERFEMWVTSVLKLSITLEPCLIFPQYCAWFSVSLKVSHCIINFNLTQSMKAQMGSRFILCYFFNLGTRWVWVVNATPQPLYPRKEIRYALCQVGLRAGLDMCRKSRAHGDSIPRQSRP